MLHRLLKAPFNTVCSHLTSNTMMLDIVTHKTFMLAFSRSRHYQLKFFRQQILNIGTWYHKVIKTLLLDKEYCKDRNKCRNFIFQWALKSHPSCISCCATWIQRCPECYTLEEMNGKTKQKHCYFSFFFMALEPSAVDQSMDLVNVS